MDILLKSYHDELQFFLKEFNCDSEIYLKKDLEEHWKKYAKFGLALAFLSLKILTTEINKRPNANNVNLSVEEFIDGFQGPPNEDYGRRIKEIVKYCVNNELV